MIAVMSNNAIVLVNACWAFGLTTLIIGSLVTMVRWHRLDNNKHGFLTEWQIEKTKREEIQSQERLRLAELKLEEAKSWDKLMTHEDS